MPLTKLNRRRGFGLVVLMAAAAALVALTGSSFAGSSASEATAPDTVVVAQGADPTTMDPHQQRETTTFNVLSHLYDPLLMRDTADPRKFDPVLATSWKVLGPTQLQLKLRTGVSSPTGRTSTPRRSSTTSTAFSARCQARSHSRSPPTSTRR